MKRLLSALCLSLVASTALAARPLKEDTAVTIVVGPFIAPTDGAAVTAPTIASIDITAYKNDGTAVTITPASGSSTDNDMNHVDDGYFSLELTTTDTSTPGYLRLTFAISGALIFHEDFEVLPANVYDSRYGSDKLEVDVITVEGSDATDALGTAQTGDAFARLGAPTGASVSADIAAVKAETATIVVDTNELQTDWTNGGRLDLLVDGILADTAEIGTAGAGLTALPWNASWDAEVQSECTDALNAYDPPTKAELDSAVANVSVDEIQATALADLFNTDSATTYASAVAGSVVKEIADNAGGSALTAGEIADAVWDEAQSGHTDAGTFGLYLDSAVSGVSTGGVSASDIADAVWDEARAGHATAGTFGEYVNIGDLSLDWPEEVSEAIATEVRGELATELAFLDVAISSRLPTASYTAAPSAATVASQVRTELTTELGRIDAAISTRSTLDAAGIRTAVGLASANLDTQLGSIDVDLSPITDKLPAGGRNMAGAGDTATNLDEITAEATVDEEAIATAVAEELGEVTSSQPRINKEPSPAFTRKIDRQTHRAASPIYLTSGSVGDIAYALDMSPLFGPKNFVKTVGEPSISGGSITFGTRGPRDTYAMVILSGTATAGEERTATMSVEMETGDTVTVEFDLKVLED